jgi:hypothetical protein
VAAVVKVFSTIDLPAWQGGLSVTWQEYCQNVPTYLLHPFTSVQLLPCKRRGPETVILPTS